jgi:hypothetical protein
VSQSQSWTLIHILRLGIEKFGVQCRLLADTVAKVQNRKAPKISRKLMFGELYRCNA